MKFIDRIKDGSATMDHFHDAIDYWHKSTSSDSIEDHLGISREDYFILLKNPLFLQKLITQYQDTDFYSKASSLEGKILEVFVLAFPNLVYPEGPYPEDSVLHIPFELDFLEARLEPKGWRSQSPTPLMSVFEERFAIYSIFPPSTQDPTEYARASLEIRDKTAVDEDAANLEKIQQLQKEIGLIKIRRCKQDMDQIILAHRLEAFISPVEWIRQRAKELMNDSK